MHIPVVDTVNKAKAVTLNMALHASNAMQATGELRAAPDDSIQKHVAAARVVSEVDHLLLGVKDVPGVGLIPYAGPALTAYKVAKAVLDGATHTPLKRFLPDAVGAANLLGASSHLRDVAKLTAQPDVSRSQRFQALDLLDDVIDDAELGFRTLEDSPAERDVLAALSVTRRDVADKAPFDTAAMTRTADLLVEAAGQAITEASAAAAL